ncbi:MAG: hypothetical protein COB98_11670 [Flavobacteriaceae bacterium]|nr:MAG: hypothetical protein COB98_11670 [Flavobacteriaceae bacterium]
MKFFLSTFFICCTFLASTAQIKLDKENMRNRGYSNEEIQKYQDSIKGSDKEITVSLSGTTHFTDYKIISFENDTTYIDTTLTLRKYFKHNVLKRDNFELMEFHNQGQTYQKLGHDFTKNGLFPDLGANAKQFEYIPIEAINYYEVPTATTEVMYRTGMEQGQMLDILFTVNTSRKFNVSFEYRGLRSLGYYRNALASHGNFRGTFNYQSKKGNYAARGHMVSYDFYNDEYGGLTQESLQYFETNDSNYTDRGRMEVNFTDADNMFEGKRYYLDHHYTLGKVNDSIQANTKLKIGHQFTYETQHYRFNQATALASYFGEAYQSEISDHTEYQKMNNQVYAELKSPIVLGKLRATANLFNYNYHYNSVLFLNDKTIPSRLKGNALSVGADWDTHIKKFKFRAKASSILTDDITGYELNAVASYKKDSLYEVKITALSSSKTPNFNFLLQQSDYKKYNWHNTFDNQKVQKLGFDFNSDKIIDVNASYTILNDYTYFNENQVAAQYNGTINYFKLKVHKAITVGKFTLDNTFLYQEVISDDAVLNVPTFVTRNTLYFSDYVFKGNTMFLQTGITFKYFSSYYADNYNPLLSEFSTQNTTKIGDFPMFDLFINAEIRRTRLFFKIENIGASLTGRDYYSAPSYPYRDFTIRFGLVWNWFI